MTSILKPKRVAAAATVAASEYRFPGRSERAVGSNGEVNAYSKRDLLMNALEFQRAASNGEVATDGTLITRERMLASRRDRREMLAAAAHNDQVHRQLGEAIAREIYMTTNRKGIARQFLNPIELKQGDIPRFPVRSKNVRAVVLTGPSRVETQVVTDKWLTPQEVQIGARPFVPQNELNQSNSDVLEEKAVEALEAVMVGEDRRYYNMVRASIGTDNNQSLITGTLSPQSLMAVRQNVAQWGLKPVFCWMASDLFVDVVGDASFIQAIDPVARHELLLTGHLGVIYGMTIISEGYRHPEHKVLSEGEFVIVSEPATHGAYSDRGGVDSRPIDTISENVVGRGWLMTESWASAIANTRSVAVGLRV